MRVFVGTCWGGAERSWSYLVSSLLHPHLYLIVPHPTCTSLYLTYSAVPPYIVVHYLLPCTSLFLHLYFHLTPLMTVPQTPWLQDIQMVATHLSLFVREAS